MINRENFKVIILAGGDSTRFWPLADKHRLKFINKYLIERLIGQLQTVSLKDIIIVGNGSNLPIFNKIKKEFTGLNIEVREQTLEGGMAGAILSVKDRLEGSQVLILQPHDVFETKLLVNLKKSIDDGSDALMCGITQSSYFPGGYLTVDQNNLVRSIVEKPKREEIPSNEIKLVADYFKSASVLTEELSGCHISSDDAYEQSLGSLMKKGLRITYLNYRGFWSSLKYPWQVLDINRYLLGQISSSKIETSLIDKTAKITGNVIIGKGVKILEGAKILGPCFIGDGCVIGNGSVIRESSIGKNNVIGYCTEMARSYVGNGCWFHSNYIGDSVILDNVSMGAGTVLANFKLSESEIISQIKGSGTKTGRFKLGAIIGSNVRIGVNCSIMPGVKIGSNTAVGAGIVLSMDLPDGKFISQVEAKYSLRDNKSDNGIKFRESEIDKLKT